MVMHQLTNPHLSLIVIRFFPDYTIPPRQFHKIWLDHIGSPKGSFTHRWILLRISNWARTSQCCMIWSYPKYPWPVICWELNRKTTAVDASETSKFLRSQKTSSQTMAIAATFLMMKKHGETVQTSDGRPKKTSWWFQPIWKILVKMGIFPK